MLTVLNPIVITFVREPSAYFSLFKPAVPVRLLGA